MNWFKETYLIVKWLFTGKPSNQNDLIVTTFKYYPFKSYSEMSWCGHLIRRQEYAFYPIDKTTTNHELIHLYQAKRFRTWISYYLSYLIQWIKGNPFFRSAYYTNPYEMEAYANESSFDYISHYEMANINKYKLKHRRQIWKQIGNNLTAWKCWIKTL